MKTFTANEFRRTPQKVYREADIEGAVKINHGNYKDKVFVLKSKPRGVEDNER